MTNTRELTDKGGRIVWHRQPTSGLVDKVISATTSLVSGRATDEVIAERNAQCAACDKLERVEDKRYCGACGCPRSPLSELSTKLAFAYLKCPLGKSGFSA